MIFKPANKKYLAASLTLSLTLFTGIILSVVLFVFVQRLDKRQFESEFNLKAADRTEVIIDSFEDHITTLYYIASLFDSSQDVRRSEFYEFTKNIFLLHPDILAVSWIPRVKEIELLGYEVTAFRDGILDFQIKAFNEQGQIIKSETKQEYFPVYYIEPYKENKMLLGLDLSSDRVRWQAMEKATDTGLPAATAKINLARDLTNPQRGFGTRVFMPVYRKDAAAASQAGQQNNLIGFVSLLFRASDTIELRLKTLSAIGIDIYLFDKTSGLNSERSERLYFHHSRTRQENIRPLEEAELEDGRLLWVKDFDMAGRKWSIICIPAPAFFSRYYKIWQPWVALATGLLLTLLFSYYLFTIIGRSAKIQKLVDERTAELRDSEEKYKDIAKVLQQAKERAELLYKVVPSAIFTVDKECRITSWNNKAADLTGYTAEELLGKPCSIFSDLPCKDECILNSLNISMPVIDRECTIRRKDGQVRTILKNIDVLRDENGNVAGSIESFEDVTERKNSEEELRKLSRAIEQSPSVVVITDTKGNIEYVNPKFSELTDYAPEEVIGKNPRIFKSGEMPPEAYNNLWNTIIAGSEWQGELHNKKKSGKLYWEFASISAIRNPQGVAEHYLKVSEDITERKRLEKLKDEFVGNVSHELRTPLSIIKEGIDLVLDRIVGEINQKQQSVLVTAKDNIDRLSRMINELLDMSKIEAGKLELKRSKVGLAELIKKIATGFQGRIKEKGLELKFDFSAKEITAYADPDKISQVFINLLSNAVKFTNEGSIEISAQDKGDEVECYVKDTGIGIEEENMPKVFDKFQQFGRISGPGERGTGLGLSIVKGLIEMHGGRIWAESKFGEGAKFTFVLPKSIDIIP